jgi:hypothetical protein
MSGPYGKGEGKTAPLIYKASLYAPPSPDAIPERAAGSAPTAAASVPKSSSEQSGWRKPNKLLVAYTNFDQPAWGQAPGRRFDATR